MTRNSQCSGKLEKGPFGGAFCDFGGRHGALLARRKDKKQVQWRAQRGRKVAVAGESERFAGPGFTQRGVYIEGLTFVGAQTFAGAREAYLETNSCVRTAAGGVTAGHHSRGCKTWMDGIKCQVVALK